MTAERRGKKISENNACISHLRIENGGMKTEYEVTVKETNETKTVGTLEEVREWAELVRRTLGVWGSEPTFECVKHTREEVAL